MKRFMIFAAVLFAVLAAVMGCAAADAAVGITFAEYAFDPLEDMPADRLSTENLSREELAATSKEVLAYLRNRIYANHGYIFKTEKWRDVFTHFDWYKPNPKFSVKLFNKYENENLKRIIEAEKRK